MRISSFLGAMVSGFALLIIAYAVMTALHVPIGSFSDWLFGMLSLFWLLAIVTVPWNIYFKAHGLLAEAGPTRERGLVVDERQVAYVRKLAKYSLWIAIGLHIASAIALFLLAWTGFSKIGYVASVLALLLTGLRPAVSAYEYLAARLHSIGETWKYPREDVVELRGRVTSLESSVNQTRLELDPDRPESLVARQLAHAEQFRHDLARLEAGLESLRATNESEHERLSREAQTAISQISVDGQFLDHVREILRFFKSA
jgi:hypothetical protein